MPAYTPLSGSRRGLEKTIVMFFFFRFEIVYADFLIGWSPLSSFAKLVQAKRPTELME